MCEGLIIYLYVDGERYGMRHWTFLPVPGDILQLSEGVQTRVTSRLFHSRDNPVLPQNVTLFCDSKIVVGNLKSEQ